MKHKRNSHDRTKYSLMKAVLDIILDLGEQVAFETPFHNTKRQWRKALGIPTPPVERWRYNRAIKYLEKWGQLNVIRKNNKLFLKLTRKGKLQALMDRIQIDFKKHIAWDGKWRLIVWDIPEKSSVDRNRLRRLVKDLEFSQLQKSVFITPYPLPSSAVEYLQSSKLMKYIRFLRVDKMENDRYLKKKYGLK